MDATPIYALPYPETSDPPDGPTQIQALADAVEAAIQGREDYWRPLYAVKAATEPLTNSTTLQDDDHLYLDLEAGRTYKVELHAGIAGASGGDIKLAWRTTGTINLLAFREGIGPSLSTANISDTTMRSGQATLANEIGYGTAGGTGRITEYFLVTCTVAGRLQLQWAQNALSGTASSVGSQSWLMATPID